MGNTKGQRRVGAYPNGNKPIGMSSRGSAPDIDHHQLCATFTRLVDQWQQMHIDTVEIGTPTDYVIRIRYTLRFCAHRGPYDDVPGFAIAGIADGGSIDPRGP